MTRKLAVILPLLLLLLQSCSSKKETNTSRVDHFEYQGYGDTIVSLLYGEVVEKKSTSVTDYSPLQQVSVSVTGVTQTDSTNASGEFVVGLSDGIYEIRIAKPGYQTMILSNYISDPDRVSLTKIILEKGSGEQTFKIPAPDSK